MNENIITPDDYHSDQSRISKSGLDLIERSPLHYWNAYLNPNRIPKEDTPALLLGSAVHCAILEPDEFKKRFVVMPSFDKRTKEGKAKYEAFMFDLNLKSIQNKCTITPIEQDVYDTCARMQDAVYNHPMASQLLLQDGKIEQRYDFENEMTGAKCKIKPDKFLHNSGICLDVKTTEDASPQSFGKSVANYRYDKQASFYMDGLNSIGHKCDAFIFICVEKTPPYAVACYYATPSMIDIGRNTYISNLFTYMECLESGKWLGYSQKIEPVELQGWFIHKHTN